MKRRALIIFCDNTKSGELFGPPCDNLHFRKFLRSNLGGAWKEDSEILSLNNPSSTKVIKAVKEFLNGSDYTFTVFSGHGFLNTDENRHQFIELSDESISILNLRTTAKRQALIIDACRGFYSPSQELLKSLDEKYFSMDGISPSTRKIFDDAVIRADEGLTILYAASKNQTALDTDKGAAYLTSLLKVAERWENKESESNMVMDLMVAHNHAAKYLTNNFETIQNPSMNQEKRKIYFPFAVKLKSQKENDWMF